MTDLKLTDLTDEQRDQLVKSGIITPDAVTEPVEDDTVESENEDIKTYDDMPAIKQVDTGRPSARFAFLNKARGIAEKLQEVEDAEEDVKFETFVKVMPEMETFVLNAAENEAEMEAWFSDQELDEALNKVMFAFQEVLSSQEKKFAS